MRHKFVLASVFSLFVLAISTAAQTKTIDAMKAQSIPVVGQ